MEITCPACESNVVKKNGFTRHGKQNHRCLDCGRQFSQEATSSDFNGLISQNIDEKIYVTLKD